MNVFKACHIKCTAVVSSLGDVLKSPAALKNNTTLLVDEFQCA